MKSKVILLFLIFCIWIFVFDSNAATFNSEPSGKGSLPSRLFKNRTICLIDEKNPTFCEKKLIRLPQKINKAHSATFYGVFDIDNDGSPEVFIDYWSAFNKKKENNAVTFIVYKKILGKYRQYLKLEAESHGYAPGAWFILEPRGPGAFFMTRYGGSSGAGLFYLDMKNKSLNLISDMVYLEDNPEFTDLDNDGISEIFLPGRGRDRTSNPGAAILHWKDDGYHILWPDWEGLPTVIYAAITDANKDGNKKIAAILEPDEINYDKFTEGATTFPRELGVWQISDKKPFLISKTKIPDSRYMSEPVFGRFPPISSSIELIYSKTIGCKIKENIMECREEK